MQAAVYLGVGQRERLALFSGEEFLELFTVGLDEVSVFEQEASALGERCLAP